MVMRLPVLSAMRAPATPVISFLRQFSSTAAVAHPPRETHPPARTSTPSSTSRLQSINKDRMSVGGAKTRSPGASSLHRIGQAYRERAAASLQARQDSIDFVKNKRLSQEYLRQMPRRWVPGDVYSPHDLSPREMNKWRRRNAPEADVVDILGLRPLDMYKNFSLIQEFTNSSGQIKHSKENALRPVNQRKVAKMIRRIQGMGLYPTIHDHPELIRADFYPSEQRRG